MEYFLQLSVMAMVISCLSIFLIDYQQPKTAVDPENDQSPSNPSDLMDDSTDEFVATKKEQLQKSVPVADDSAKNTLKKLHIAKNILREIKRAFSMLRTTHKSIFSTTNF